MDYSAECAPRVANGAPARGIDEIFAERLRFSGKDTDSVVSPGGDSARCHTAVACRRAARSGAGGGSTRRCWAGGCRCRWEAYAQARTFHCSSHYLLPPSLYFHALLQDEHGHFIYTVQKYTE